MYAVAKREFLTMFKSVKSVAIILLFIIVSFSISNFVKNNPVMAFGQESNPYLSGIRFLVTFLGFLFVLALSHDTLNREVETQTMRFVVTKVSRTSVVLGKYLGILSFWVACLSISFLAIFVSAQQFDLFELIRLIVFLSYAIGMNMLVSTIITKVSFSMFTGLICGLLLPTIGIWGLFSTNPVLQLVQYATPYYYLLEEGWKSYIPFGFSILFAAMSIFVFRRKDL
ncbi:ABC transporter permease [Paenibacillus sp. DMB20]|uniref:ABC transporter permease n=1 Tax=Paenibacillus sp. DMB20 TaxID=1642570 RepID=UPI000627F999|nr:hypothetical protein [Paenibacillus sp. DMB20]KKO53895.1 hypothetical protein XI25_09815 [Paenibacillus sp. DMB20]